MNVTEELLDLQSLKGQTRGTDLFVSASAAVDEMKLLQSKVSGMITDGQNGLSTLICNKVNTMKLHCIIHHQALKSAKHLKFDHVIKPGVKAINSISLSEKKLDIFWLKRDR